MQVNLTFNLAFNHIVVFIFTLINEHFSIIREISRSDGGEGWRYRSDEDAINVFIIKNTVVIITVVILIFTSKEETEGAVSVLLT